MPALKITEADVTGQIRDFMRYSGWRYVRMQRTAIAGAFSTGEPGMADALFIRYTKRPRLMGSTVPHVTYPGVAEVVWVEFKKPGARSSCRCEPLRKKRCTVCDQKAWQERERRDGALVWVVSSFDDFEVMYREAFGR